MQRAITYRHTTDRGLVTFDSAGTFVRANEYITEIPAKIVEYRGYHSHTDYELEIITGGFCKQIINGNVYECAPGTVVFMSPMDVHEYVFDKSLTTLDISFSENMLMDIVMKSIDIRDCPFIADLKGDAYQSAKSDFETIINETRLKSQNQQAYIKCLLNKLIIETIRNAHYFKKSSAVADENYMKTALSYIRYNFKEEITLAHISSLVHVTPNHFCKYFHKKIGTSFQEYLLNLRLEYAKNLIISTENSVSDISSESGFNTPHYFSRVFKAKYGMSPTEYRNKFNR